MDTSKFIAKILGVLYIFVGLGCLVSPEAYRSMYTDLLDLSMTTFMACFSMIIVGMFMVRYHNIWEKSWRVIITLVGWIALIEGAIFLVFPNLFSVFRPMLETTFYYSIGGVCSLVIGLILAYFGFRK